MQSHSSRLKVRSAATVITCALLTYMVSLPPAREVGAQQNADPGAAGLLPDEEEPSMAEINRTFEAVDVLRRKIFPLPGPGLSFGWHGARILDFYAHLDWAGSSKDGTPIVRATTLEAIEDSLEVQVNSAAYAPGEQTVEELLCGLQLRARKVTSEQCPELRGLYESFRSEWMIAALPEFRADGLEEIRVIADGQTVEVSIESGDLHSTSSEVRDDDAPLFQWVARATKVLRACAPQSAEAPRARAPEQKRTCMR